MQKTERKTRDKQYIWDLEALYPSEGEWEKAFHHLVKVKEGGWKNVLQYKGGDLEDPAILKSLLDALFSEARELEKVYTFAHLRHDEDVTNELFKTHYQKIVLLYHEFNNAVSWIEPEILQIEEKTLKKLCGEVKEYQVFLKKLLMQKPHILSSDKEEILALSLKVQGAPKNAFSALSYADLKFPDVLDKEGKTHPLTQGSYQVLLKSQDRILRENAFKGLHGQFSAFKNTLCELVQGQVQGHVFNQRVRNYASCVESALKPHQIPVSVYKELIQTTRENIDALHDYIALRKKTLKVDELQYWDLSVPMSAECDLKFSYEEAVEIVLESTAILGEEYQETLRKGLCKDRWSDVYENPGKRTGAYSSGCYDSRPYILLNFQGTLNDLMTLSHEAGHSMNTLLSNKKQKYHEAQYPIFVAEVASTFHEQLTYEYLLKRAKTKEEKLYILNQQIDGMRATFFRQVMFAEFELKLHELAENHVPLTPGVLEKEYKELNQTYFGRELVLDDLLSIEFLRVPHFYYNFYVYQYATGIAAAVTLVDKVKKEGNKKYLEFLASGGSDYPIQLLRKVGVDMETEEPTITLIRTFRDLVKKLKNAL